MKSLPIVAALILALACLGTIHSNAAAYGLSGIGARVGEVNPEGSGNAFEVGGHLEFEQSGSRLHL